MSSSLMNKGRVAVALVAWLGASGLAHAQMQKDLNEEYAKRIQTAEAIATFGNDLFGEQVNLYTGSTEFTVTDVSLRGNNALPVEVRRSFVVQMRDGNFTPGSFADWELDIPHLVGTFEYKSSASEVGWQVSTGTPNARCAVTDYNFAVPPEALASGPISGNDFAAEEFWAGNTLHVPGGGNQEMLVLGAENMNRPTDGATYYWTTSGQWFFSCLSSTANGISGQGFLARSPDGTTYRFDHIIKRNASSLRKPVTGAGRGTGEFESEGEEEPVVVQPRAPNDAIMRRQEIRILPTLVTDRFGNTVTYTYASTSSGNVTQIASSDGRSISLTYGANGVSTVTADGRTWTYTYATTTSTGLSTVSLPDGSSWQYDLANLRQVSISYVSDASTCAVPGDAPTGGPGTTSTITHPSGAVGTFAVGWRRHGRSYVPKSCFQFGTGVRGSVIPQNFDAPGLLSKQISGPGIPTATWSYSYGSSVGSWLEDCPLPTSCARTKTVTVTGPGEWSRYTFGTKVGEDEGKLLKTERGNSATDILRVDATTYQTNPAGQIYPVLIGENPHRRSDGTAQYYAPERKKVTTQQGRTFTWEVPAVCAPNGATGTQLCFDRFGRPTKVVKSSAPAP